MASAGNKTIVACRPGMQQSMQAAFAGMEVVVDDKLTVDYEFRERELTGMELIEAEVEEEERFEADPKKAHTVMVPLTRTAADYDEDHWNCGFLVVRASGSNGSDFALMNEIKKVKAVLGDEYEINAAATIGALNSHLKSAGWQVYSISESTVLTLLAD